MQIEIVRVEVAEGARLLAPQAYVLELDEHRNAVLEPCGQIGAGAHRHERVDVARHTAEGIPRLVADADLSAQRRLLRAGRRGDPEEQREQAQPRNAHVDQ